MDMKDARVVCERAVVCQFFQCLGGPGVLPTMRSDESVLSFYNESHFMCGHLNGPLLLATK